MTIDELKKHIKNHEKEAFALNNQIANDPELSGQEYHACKRYVTLCRSLGMEVTEQFAKESTAFKAIVHRAEHPVMRIAVLAEYDALPGVGHGCGHSASGAVSFLAAAALQHTDIPVDIDLIGTPDEELHGGKVGMCEENIFTAYDLAVMIHMSPNKTTSNSHFLALDDYRIMFHGQTAHAASEPWNGRNALNGAVLAMHAIDMLRQHVRPETRIGIYMVQGGTASNIIPDCAELECCIRHTERAYLDTVVAKIMKCFEGAAIATDTTYEVRRVGYAFDNMIWNQAATQAVESIFHAMNIPFQNTDDCGSSDIGNVSHQCPALHLHLAMGTIACPEHSIQIAEMVKNPAIEPVIRRGAEIIGRLVLKLAADESLRKHIREEFQKEIG